MSRSPTRARARARARARHLLLFLLFACGSRTGLEDPEAVDPPGDCIPLDDETRLEIPYTHLLENADVVFLVDATRSMHTEIDVIRDRLQDTLAPAIAEEIPHVRFGVAYHGDFPVGDYGDAADRPYGLAQEMTTDLDLVEQAVDAVPNLSGHDSPESQVEALYQTATGEGLGTFVDPASCPEGTLGYPCFGERAVPIVLFFTDAPFHNGPSGEDPYFGIDPSPHTFAEAIGALRDIGARVVGFDSGEGFGRPHLEETVRQTGGDASELVFDIGFDGEELDTQVIESMRILANEAPIASLDARTVDDEGDSFDATLLVRSLRAISAEPPDGADVSDGTATDVRPGTTIVFELVLSPIRAPEVPKARTYGLSVLLEANGSTVLFEQRLAIRVSGTEERAECPDAP